MSTNVKVRVQSNGGKYLGAAVAKTPPVLTVTVPGFPPIGPMVFPTSNSGVVCPSQSAGASPIPIVVEPGPGEGYKPGTYYLLPPCDPFTDSALIVPLPLPDTPTHVTFSVTAFAPQPVTLTMGATLTGGQDYTADPGIILRVPGLRITDAAVAPAPGGSTVTANVAMMCGCMITPENPATIPAEPYWPAYEFNVTCQIAGAATAPIPLTCIGTSLFEAVTNLPYPAGQDITVFAEQPSMSNANSVTVNVPPIDK
jgi:hypothetical protein